MSTLVEQPGLKRQTVFSRVLVGVDSSDESQAAATQAAVLADGQLTLLAAYEITAALVGGAGRDLLAVAEPGGLVRDLRDEHGGASAGGDALLDHGLAEIPREALGVRLAQ